MADEFSMMQKGGRVKSLSVTDEDMELINQYALEPIEKSGVYVFKVAICDNEIDRDFERFDDAALEQMAKHFVGKTIIKDHRRTSDNQFARIYAVEVVGSSGKTSDGLPGKELVAKCYTLNTEANAGMVADIKAGIKKEVSVGFRATSAICSICKTDNAKASCAHWWGKEYDGGICHFTLTGITDAYELSFVAVPAQRNAGTKKAYMLEKEHDEESVGAKLKQEVEQSSHESEVRFRVAKAFLTITKE